MRLVHRFTKGVSLQAFYTFAKSLDNASTIGGTAPIVVQQDLNFAAERGLSSFDVRHQVRVASLYEPRSASIIATVTAARPAIF